MERDEFEKIVHEGIQQIPKKFLEKLENVEITIDDEPSLEQKQKFRLGNRMTLFGLYEGIPKSKRGPHYAFVLPDKITIFQKSIENASRDVDEMKNIVRDTVWHEIAHHFGFRESEIREIEKKKRQA